MSPLLLNCRFSVLSSYSKNEAYLIPKSCPNCSIFTLGMNHQLTTAEEAAFMKMLENILETAYNMQEESEHMFIYQESVLNKSKRKALSVNFVGISETDGNGSTSSLSRHPLLSVSSVDQV